MSEPHYLSTTEVARQLGVKPETVYAYVSRGLLTSVRNKGTRGSRFDQREVDRLAERGHGDSEGGLERIRTGLTLLESDELYYRGQRVTTLARTHSVESVADLLWNTSASISTKIDATKSDKFAAPAELVELARAAMAVLPDTATLTDQLRVGVTALGAADPLRFDLNPFAVVHTARRLLGTLTAALTPSGAGASIAEKLWPALSDRRAEPELLNAALVLLADHGLATSTLAVRVAASARAHVYAVVSAGLGAADGPYHGAASLLAYRFLAEARSDPIGALSERMRAGMRIPGFGHRVYQHRDPRAELLFELLDGAEVLDTVNVLRAELAERSAIFPNVDLALAAMAHAHGMRPDAGLAVFELARTIGWIAHALEEYGEPALRFRPVGVYTGPATDNTG